MSVISDLLLSTTPKYEDLEDMDLPMSFKERQTMARIKLNKYKWVANICADILFRKTGAVRLRITQEDMRNEAYTELWNQLRRLYGIPSKYDKKEMRDAEYGRLFYQLYDYRKNDLTVGPFFMKGMKKYEITPFPSKNDAASLRYIKIRLLEYLHENIYQVLGLTNRDLKDIAKLKKVAKDYQFIYKSDKVPDSYVLGRLKTWTRKRLDGTYKNWDTLYSGIQSYNDATTSGDDDYGGEWM